MVPAKLAPRAPCGYRSSVPSSSEFSSETVKTEFYRVFGEKQGNTVLEEVAFQASKYGYPEITEVEERDGIATVCFTAGAVGFSEQYALSNGSPYKGGGTVFRR